MISFITGKPPLFEIRQWDDSDNELPKYAPLPEENLGETSDLTNNNITSSDNEPSEDDKDHPRTWSTKWSTSGPVMTRSSPMQVYTYKVNCLRLHVMVRVLSDWKLYHDSKALIIVSFSNCIYFILERINCPKYFLRLFFLMGIIFLLNEFRFLKLICYKWPR